MELTSFENLKHILNLDGDEIAEYPGLEIIRDSVVSAIESYVGRYLENKERTESFCLASDSCMIGLKGLPMTTIPSAITLDGEDVSEYVITNYGIRLTDKPTAHSLFSCTYTGGYSVIPSDLERAALIQTVYEFQNKEHMGAESVSTEGGSVSRPALGLLREVRRLLDPYKHPLMWV